jgi:tetratricopeptide (TPR) repeat protein
MSLRRWLVLIGVTLLAVPGTAQTNSCIEDISTRLEARLKTLPDRWDKIPPPLIPVSGQSSEEVLATASEEERALVSEWITFLALSPQAERAALISREIQARPLSEVDVWLPERFTDELRTKSLEEPTLYVEAWLEWAEALGRKDALLLAAGLGLERLSLQGESRGLLEIASRWAGLPSPDYATRGRADVLSKYALRLFRAGENDKALGAYRSALKLFAEVGDRRGQGYALNGEAGILYRLGDNEKALDAYRSARKLFEDIGDRRGQGNAFDGEAYVLYALGDNEKALDAYRSAHKLFEEVGDRRGQGYTFCGEADVLHLLGDKEKALDAYRSARKLFEEVGDRRGQGDTFCGEADVVLYQLGDNEKALDAYRRARKLFEQVGDRRGQGATLVGEAEVLYLLGDNEKALDAYRSARKLYEQVGSRLGQGNTFKGEADVLLLLGETEKAADAYRSARQLFEQVGERRGQGDTFVGEAQVFTQLGATEKALSAYRSARKLYEQVGYRLGQGNTFDGEANRLLELGEYEKALDAYRSARKLYEQVGSRQGQGLTFDGEAEVLFELGETEKALDAYRSARKLYEQVGDGLGQGYTFLGEAEVLFRLNDNEKALDAYRSACQLFEQAGYPRGIGDSLLGEARVQSLGNERDAKNLASQAVAAYRKAGAVDGERDAWLSTAAAEYSSGNLEPAASAALEAVRLHAVWRSKRVSERQRTQEDESIAAAYDILVPALFSLARTEQALAAAEEARSHVLLDLLAAGFKYGKPGTATDLRAERQRLVSELAQVETESRQAADAGRLADLQIHRNQIDRNLDWNQYQTLAAEQDALLTAQPLDVAGIRAVARETGPILLYYAADKELIGFLVPSDGTDVFAARIDLSRGRLAEAVQRYIHDEANPFYADRAAQQSRELWDLLLAPFAARLPAGGPLVIVPHGPLHELPFETLVDPAGTPVMERWSVSFAPSVSTLARARERHKEPQPKDSFLVFSSGRGLELPAAEAGEVARLFGNDKAAFKPTEASFESYEHLVPGARQLLISTTGTWVPGDQRKTYLEILPTPDVHDSRLSVAEIAAIPLTAELVALEACDTARGETRSTDERLDLTRAFLTAGAASVLATRWKVPDEPATTRFLLDFYRAYRQGGPGGQGLRKDQALTEARRRSRDERGDPAQIWAAWLLVGDAR